MGFKYYKIFLKYLSTNYNVVNILHIQEVQTKTIYDSYVRLKLKKQ